MRLLSSILVFCFIASSTLRAADAVMNFYSPMPEEQLHRMMQTMEIDEVVSTNIRSITSITIAFSNTVIYFDHWEDSYEAVITSPTQTTSRVWGDGITNNGYLPGNLADLLPLGTNISLDNWVQVPGGGVQRDSSVIRYDGRDKISSTKPITVQRAFYPDAPQGPLMANGFQVLDSSQYGLLYRAPVGQNLRTNALFDYVGMAIMAAENPTLVKIDTNADGVVDQQVWLTEGQPYIINGGISVGATVSGVKQFQAVLVTGVTNGNYQSRCLEMFPDNMWDSRYVCPVPTATNNSPTLLFVHNPNTNSITVYATNRYGQTSLSVPAGWTTNFVLSTNTATMVFTTNAAKFLPACAVSAGVRGSQAYNWGFSPVPFTALTPQTICGWGWGDTNRTANYNPFFVTVVSNATVYIDYDGNPSTGTTNDPLGNKCNLIFTNMPALTMKALYDTDNDQTGMKAYTLDGTYVVAAWGQWPGNPTPTAGSAMDMGCTTMPFPYVLVRKSDALVNDVNANGMVDPGDSLRYDITTWNFSSLPVNNVILHDFLPANADYTANSSTNNGVSVPDDAVGTPFPLDGNGYNLGTISGGGSNLFSYVLSVDNPFPTNSTVVVNAVYISSSQGQRCDIDPVRIRIPGLTIEKSSGARDALDPGATNIYTLIVRNTGTVEQVNIQLNDPAPGFTTYVTNSTVVVLVSNVIQNTVRDLFGTVAYTNNSGTTNWTGNWQENGDNGTPTNGWIFVSSTSNSLFMTYTNGTTGLSTNFGVWRKANLFGYTTAEYSFFFRRSFVTNDPGKYVYIAASTNGTNWTIIDTIFATTNDPPAGVYESYDLTGYISSNTSVGFFPGGTNWVKSNDWFLVDDVQIEFTKPGLSGPPVTTNASPVLINNGILLPGQSYFVTFKVTVDSPPLSQWIQNTAYVVSDKQNDPLYASVTDAVRVADLAITKAVSKIAPATNEVVTYTITVTNNGPMMATNIVAREPLTNGLTYISSSASQGSYNGTNWNIGMLNPGGAAAILQIQARIDTNMNRQIIMNVSSITNSSLYDPYSWNNQDNVSVYVGWVPNLSVSKRSGSADPVYPGSNITYTIVVTNTGDFPLTGIQLSDIIPDGMTYVPYSSTIVAPTTTTFTVSDLFNYNTWTNNNGTTNWSTAWERGAAAPAVSTTVGNPAGSLYFTATNQMAQRHANSVGCSSAILSFDYKREFTGGTPAANSNKYLAVQMSSNGGTAFTTVGIVSGAVFDASFFATNINVSSFIGSGPTSTVVRFIEGSRSNGNVYIDNVKIAFENPTVLLTNAAGTPPSLAQWYQLKTGEVMTVTFTATVDIVTSETQFVNTVSASSDQTVAKYSYVTNRLGRTDLGVTKTASESGSVHPGTNETVWYKIVLTNNGPEYATSVQLRDIWPTNVVFSNAVPSQGSYSTFNPASHVWTVGTVAPGGSATLIITGVVNVATYGVTFTNTAAITHLDQVDTNSLNDTSKVAIVTIAVVTRFEAYGSGGRIVVEWETASEIGTAGYYVYRSKKGTDKQVQVNIDLVPALIGEAQGGVYRIPDPGARIGSQYLYELEEIELLGARQRYGPFDIRIEARKGTNQVSGDFERGARASQDKLERASKKKSADLKEKEKNLRAKEEARRKK